MWTLITYEYKKLFHSPLQKLLPLIVILFPLLFSTFFTEIPDESIKREFYHSIKGEMNEAWFANLETYYTLDEATQYPVETDVISQQAYRLFQLKSDTVKKSWNELGNEKQYDFIKKEMNQKSFYFDDNISWLKLIGALNMFGIFYSIYIVITITPIFSQEYNEHMMDNIKTTKVGKYHAGISKTICALLLVLTLPVIAFAFYYGVIALTQGFTDGSISLILTSRTMNPFTYRQEFFYGFLTTIVGGLSVCAISLTLSNFIKNSYLSMATSLGLLLIPTFFYMNINGILITQLFPFWFMMVSKVYESSPFITLQETTMYYKDWICLVWIPLSILLFMISIIKYRLREA